MVSSEAKEISARHAYGRRKFNFRCLALPVMAGNHYPRTNDCSHGLIRRTQIIPFDRQFGPDEADPALFPAIWKTEMPGILNRALEGLARLRKRGDFDPPEDCQRALREFLTHANPLFAFIEDRCEFHDEGRTFVKEFKAAYKVWAADQGVKRPGADKTLIRRLRAVGLEIKNVQGYPQIFGLSLRE